MKVKDLIARLSKFADLEVMIVSKQGNSKGYNLEGAELGVYDYSTDKLILPELVVSSENKEPKVVLFGDKI